MNEILPDEQLSSEELVQRRKGEALLARFEHLAQTDEGFRRWLQEGFDQVERGEVVIFDENGWHEAVSDDWNCSSCGAALCTSCGGCHSCGSSTCGR